jgi:CRISP-associated protein Cas1
MTVADLPELVPARMLNEYAYCPRLFFLEWVDSLWASNADVAEGNRRHRRVDGGGGAAARDHGQAGSCRGRRRAGGPG